MLRSPYQTPVQSNPLPGWLSQFPQREHERLQADLEDWANRHGYVWSINTLPSGKQPDVLRRAVYHPSHFLGDAKDSANETPHKLETYNRVKGYIVEFGHHLRNRTYSGGQIAIATNNFQAARSWKSALEGMTNAAAIVTPPFNEPVNFNVTDIGNGRTWIIHS